MHHIHIVYIIIFLVLLYISGLYSTINVDLNFKLTILVKTK